MRIHSIPFPRQSTPRDKKSGNDEAKQNVSKKKRLIRYRCGGEGHPAGSVHQRSHPATLTVTCLAWTIPSCVTERNDRTRGGRELLAFVDSSAVDNVRPKTVCTDHLLQATSKS